ncbi:phosphoribosylformylglycinamidine synthase subunit PurQ, partial [bacterium]|nr:phosphoribosylformylglycinamidine synthase subunit PurQ [bacterium]
MNFGIIQFPGSNCDQDCYHALASVFGQPTRYIWHKDTSLGNAECVVVPGGFSYGDYLRT